MTTDVTGADLRRVLAFAERSLAVRDFAAVEADLLGGLADLVGAHAATLHETDVRSPRSSPSAGRRDA